MMELFVLTLVSNQSDTNGILTIGIWEIVRALGALVVVVFLSILILWFYGRRMSHTRGSTMRIVDMISLDRNARICLVEVVDQYVLIGVSRENVTHLCTLGTRSEVNLELKDSTYSTGASRSRGFGEFLARAAERMKQESNDRKTKGTNNKTTD
jgi:flagellar biosynthetic protein FliO